MSDQIGSNPEPFDPEDEINALSPEFQGQIREVLEQYRPDGIVFDDYFYPIGVDDACDAATFRKFGKKGQTLADWRRANTELLVRSVAGTVRAFNRLNGTSIPFGISPVGIWANKSTALPDGSLSKGVEAHSQSFADVRKIAPFAGIVNWWADLVRGTNVKLYAGIGVYNAGVTAGMESPNEISNQVLYLILRKEVSGVVFFAARHCLNPQNSAHRSRRTRRRRLRGRRSCRSRRVRRLCCRHKPCRWR